MQNKFKVGEEVRFIRNPKDYKYGNYFGVKFNDIGQVISVSGFNCFIKFNNGHIYVLPEWIEQVIPYTNRTALNLLIKR